MERTMSDRAPELLDDAATIARRIVQIADPTADAGAMMLRHALWRMHETCGDGTATTAVLAQALTHNAAKAAAAGAHTALLRMGMESGIDSACDALHAQATPLPGGKRGRDVLAGLARSLCHDEELQTLLVEVAEILGADGAVKVVNHDGRRVDRDYVEGAMWELPWFFAGFATDDARTIARIEDAAVVILDGKIDSGESALEGLRRLRSYGCERAVIVASDLSDDARNLFMQAHLQGAIRLLPVKAALGDTNRALALQDMAVLTGAHVIYGGSGAGNLFALMRPEDVGEVRRAWANSTKFGLIGGRRDPRLLRERIASVRNRIETTASLEEINELRLRLGRLLGGQAILRIGGPTSGAAEERQDQARRLIRTLQAAITGGIVAGGGAALLACQPVLSGESKRSRNSKTTNTSLVESVADSLDFQMGVRCVACALEAPLAAIAQNAGYDPRQWITRAKEAGPGCGLDVRNGKLVDMIDAGVVDSAEVVARALRIAGSVAMMAITTDAIVLHRKPTTAVNP
jgi:chaperonin GroEL